MPEVALQWDITGPMLRASGVALDVRKEEPYSGYEQYDFEIPTHPEGTPMLVTRFAWRKCANLCVSSRQVLDKLPYGPVRSNNRKFVPPPRSELGHSMEAVIHHFKLWDRRLQRSQGLGIHGHRIAAWRAGRIPRRKRLAQTLPLFSGVPPPLLTFRSYLCSPKVTWLPT